MGSGYRAVVLCRSRCRATRQTRQRPAGSRAADPAAGTVGRAGLPMCLGCRWRSLDAERRRGPRRSGYRHPESTGTLPGGPGNQTYRFATPAVALRRQENARVSSRSRRSPCRTRT